MSIPALRWPTCAWPNYCLLQTSAFDQGGHNGRRGRLTGGRILLTDTPAHREQVPEPVSVFAPDDSTAMKSGLARHDPVQELVLESRTSDALLQRLSASLWTYQSIALFPVGCS